MLDPWGPLEKRFIKTWIWPSAAGWDNQWLPCVQSMHILPNLICCFNFIPSYICAYMYNILFCFGVYLPVLPKILKLLASSNEHSMFFSSYSYVILLSCFNWWIMIVVQNSSKIKIDLFLHRFIIYTFNLFFNRLNQVSFFIRLLSLSASPEGDRQTGQVVKAVTEAELWLIRPNTHTHTHGPQRFRTKGGLSAFENHQGVRVGVVCVWIHTCLHVGVFLCACTSEGVRPIERPIKLLTNTGDLCFPWKKGRHTLHFCLHPQADTRTYTMSKHIRTHSKTHAHLTSFQCSFDKTYLCQVSFDFFPMNLVCVSETSSSSI